MSCDVAEKYLNEVPEWTLLDNASRLKRTFKVNNFVDAMKLAQRVGELCEAEGHHPDLTIAWGYCRVEFQTHKISGLHENDFILAAKVNHLAETK
jgi:4a-hydroxytetrahydrobiopterin dehydratase